MIKIPKLRLRILRLLLQKIENGKLEVTGNAVGTTTVFIYNTDKKAAKVITVSVTAKATEAPAEPTKPENPKPEAPNQPQHSQQQLHHKKLPRSQSPHHPTNFLQERK